MPLSMASEPSSYTDAQLWERSKEIERLSKEIERLKNSYAPTPRYKPIGSNPTQHGPAYQNYMQDWVEKIERIGTDNYPSAALEIKQAVAVLVDVALNADGSVHAIRILRSSGYPEIDESVTSLVKLAAPFAPIPETIKRETDVLHIVRQWRFTPKSETGNSGSLIDQTLEKYNQKTN